MPYLVELIETRRFKVPVNADSEGAAVANAHKLFRNASMGTIAEWEIPDSCEVETSDVTTVDT